MKIYEVAVTAPVTFKKKRVKEKKKEVNRSFLVVTGITAVILDFALLYCTAILFLVSQLSSSDVFSELLIVF